MFLLCLQLVAPALHFQLQPDFRTANGDLFERLGEHALCLGAIPGPFTGRPTAPGQPVKDHHDDLASCCFWHSNAGQPAPGNVADVAVSFDIAGIAFRATTYRDVVPVYPFATFSARAPPVAA